MTRIDFYILPEADETARLAFACKLTGKIYRQRSHKIYLHADSQQMAHQLDEQLWATDTAFLPHNLVGEGPEPAPPIQVGHQEPGSTRDVMINLAHPAPSFFAQFRRVAEIISQQPDVLENSRERWKFYKDRGYELHSHHIVS